MSKNDDRHRRLKFALTYKAEVMSENVLPVTVMTCSQKRNWSVVSTVIGLEHSECVSLAPILFNYLNEAFRIWDG